VSLSTFFTRIEELMSTMICGFKNEIKSGITKEETGNLKISEPFAR
jgi:hypothetical protein